jgi:peptide/nickel transport system substrate-binding protein
MRRFHLFALLGALIAITLTATRPALAADDHTLVWVDGLDVNVLNPLTPGAAANNFMSAMTMAYLTVAGNGPLEPALAVRVPSKTNGGISADGKTITWVLRPNLKWSDGSPLTSADIAFSVALVNDPKTNIGDRTGYDLITKVDTPSPTVAIMHLSRPYGPILKAIFSDIDPPILPKHLLAGKDVNTADYMQLPVGAGPFRYSKWLRGDRVEVEANPFYYGAKPKLAKIVYKIIPNQETATAAMHTGDADLWPSASKDTLDELSAVPGIHATVLEGARPALLMLNTKSPVMSDPAVRAALRIGLNRPSIIERSYHNGAALDESVVSKNDPEYLLVPKVPFDRAAAIAKLEAAGWKAGADGVRVKNGQRLHVSLVGGSGSATVDQIFELIRADWTALGVEVETRRYIASIFFGEDAHNGILKGGKFDAAFFSYGQIRASTLEAAFSCTNAAPNGTNYSRTCDPVLESLFKKYNATYDPAETQTIARAIQKRLEAILPVIIVTKRNEYYITDAKVTGLKIPPFSPFGAMMNTDVNPSK